MPVAEQQTEYKDLLRIDKPVEVWTPDGSYTAPRHIDINKMPVNTTLPQVILAARQRNPSQRILTSGEWHRIRERLEQTNSKLEESMVTGAYERTSTIPDYRHGKTREKYFDGLLIQIPEVDDEGNLLTDEKGILKARHIWEMALPIKSGYAKNMPPELDLFLNTIYGMEDAGKRLPDYAYIHTTPEELRNLFRGGWSWRGRGGGRVGVVGFWGPLGPGVLVAARAAAEGRIIYELDDVDFETARNTLEEAKSAPIGKVKEALDKIGATLSRAIKKEYES